MKHDVPGILSMTNGGDGGEFFICFKKAPVLDGKNVVFGEVTKGMDVLKVINSYGTKDGMTTAQIRIKDCGELK